MGKIVEDLTYEPAATPQRLSDKQAGYDAPSEATTKPDKISTDQLLKWATGAMTVDPRFGRQNQIASLDKRTAAAILELADERDQARWEAHQAREEATQAVAAREAAIVAALDEWRKPAIFGAEEARRKNRYDLKRDFDLVAQAYDKAIETVRKQ